MVGLADYSLYGYMGIVSSLVFACFGGAIGTAMTVSAYSSDEWEYDDLLSISGYNPFVPVILSATTAIYGLKIAV